MKTLIYKPDLAESDDTSEFCMAGKRKGKKGKGGRKGK